jgi:hypothetical protein
MLNVMKRGFVIAQNCRFPWLTQKELQVPLAHSKRIAGSLAYAKAREGEPERTRKIKGVFKVLAQRDF